MKAVYPTSTDITLPLITGAQSDLWEKTVLCIQQWMDERQLIPPHLTIVLPFVQLIAPVRQAWGLYVGEGFMPRFETTQTWAVRLGGLAQPGAGPTGDVITDYLQARSWLRKIDDMPTQMQIRSDQSKRLDISDLVQALVIPLVDMANDLVSAAGALLPSEREAYWLRAAELAEQTPQGVANVEAALGPLAVAWARATEGWGSDILFMQAQQSAKRHEEKQPAINDQPDEPRHKGLVVIQAGGVDVLTRNLYEQWSSDVRLWIDLDALSTNKNLSEQSDSLGILREQHPPAWQIADDAEDEAQRAAAEVITLLNEGRTPVAFCTQDRPVARRVWALLNRQNIPLADETGWTLSTTRAAALAMGVVRCGVWNASTDHILDALKALPAHSDFTKGLNELESYLRQMELFNWPAHAPDFWSAQVKAMFERVNQLRKMFHTSGKHSLWEHLQALMQVLQYSTAFTALQRDEAGREVLQTLHCYDLGMFESISGVKSFTEQAQSTQMTYAEFARWVSHALESMTFIPPVPDEPLVIFTPLARIMLRPFAAVVIPGCDDSRLTRAPKLSGFWREQDRIHLGLMSHQRWWQRLEAQWLQALRLPHVTLLWRKADGSEPLGPATLVQRVIAMKDVIDEMSNADLNLQKQGDKRLKSFWDMQPTAIPTPSPSEQLTVKTLSASAYQKLRDCPYKFYAEQLLALRETNELDDELDKRDYGNWVHQVLSAFHQRRLQQATPPTPEDDARLLDECASRHIQQYDEAAFIPWAAIWPTTAQNYLQWLRHYEAQGAGFERSETAMQYALSTEPFEILLQGRIDRIDRKKGVPVLIDYKTERYQRTQSRVKESLEDVQLPFYTLLAQGEIVLKDGEKQMIANAQDAKAFYLSLDDRQNLIHEVALDDIDEAKSALQEGIIDDIERLAQGHAAYPLGAEQVCQFCAVKGLCRKVFWGEAKVSAILKNVHNGEGLVNDDE